MHASALFISDLHLTPSMPRTAERFFEFLEKEARTHEALFILGDLFEFWVGDDAKARSPFHLEVAQKIKALKQQGTKVYFMHGNRDFLLGDAYAQKAFDSNVPPTLSREGKVKSVHHLLAFYCSSVRPL